MYDCRAMPRTPLEQQYPWIRTAPSADTIIPHRVPFPMARRFHQICAAINADLFAGEELTNLNYMALACLDDFPGVDQRRLARMAGVDPTNAGLIIDDLEAKGLVERRINGADRRARELYPTARGRKLRRQMRPKLLAAQARILAPLTPKERELLIELLARVIEANEDYARPGAGRRRPRRKSATASGVSDEQERKPSPSRHRHSALPGRLGSHGRH
jgi:MarR family transcriptional regulator, temperature-dependent positive regulator of motility